MPRAHRYIVTGCAGFIGSQLVDALLQDDHEVVGIDSFSDYYARAIKEANVASARAEPGFTLVEGDLAEVAGASLLADADGVFHLAAQPGVRGSWGQSFSIYLHDNLLATQRLLESAARAGRRVVLASSSSVYGNVDAYPTPEDSRPCPISPYGVTKLAAEHVARVYAEEHGLDCVTLRLFSVYGPRQRPDMAFARILSAMREGTPFEVNGRGTQSRDFTFVGDVVSAAVAAMVRGAPGAVYNVGRGSEATLRETIDLLGRLAGREVEVSYGEPAAGDVGRTSADTSRIRRELGWNPETSLEDGLAAQLAWSSALVP